MSMSKPTRGQGEPPAFDYEVKSKIIALITVQRTKQATYVKMAQRRPGVHND